MIFLYNNIIDLMLLSMNRKDGLKHYEVAKILNFDTRKVITIYGDRWKVELHESKGYLEMIKNSSHGSLVLIHNHPSGNGLSAADIEVLIQTPSIGIIIAIRNDGNQYILEDLYTNKTKILKYINNEASKLPKQCNNKFLDEKIRRDIIANQICNNAQQFGLYYTESRRRT